MGLLKETMQAIIRISHNLESISHDINEVKYQVYLEMKRRDMARNQPQSEYEAAKLIANGHGKTVVYASPVKIAPLSGYDGAEELQKHLNLQRQTRLEVESRLDDQKDPVLQRLREVDYRKETEQSDQKDDERQDG